MKETNMEHFRSEIESVGYSFGKQCGHILNCNHLDCDLCDFMDDISKGCGARMVKWLMSEYKPEPVLTAREKGFVEFAQEGWLSRDSDGELRCHEMKPSRTCDYWASGNSMCRLREPLCDLFPFITWEDEEPWSVEELRKLKVKGK